MSRLAGVLGIDHEILLRMWFAERMPDVLEVLEALPAPPLLTASERRLIRHIRERAETLNAELIVADGAAIMGVILAR